MNNNITIIDNIKFKPIPTATSYLVSECGKIYSTFKKRYLKYYFKSKRRKYYKVDIYDDDKNKRKKFVHRLVALAWINNPHNYPTVDHINRDTHNNSVSNIRWATLEMQYKNTKRYINKHKLN